MLTTRLAPDPIIGDPTRLRSVATLTTRSDSTRAWLKKRVAPLNRGERRVTYRQLRQSLTRFSVALENPNSNTIEVVKTETVVSGVFRRVWQQPKRLGTIGYRNEGTEVSFKDLKNVRKMCGLTESDGVDSDAFYDGADVVDTFINKYRTLLRRLAKT